MSMKLRGADVAKVIELLAKFREQESIITELRKHDGATYNVKTNDGINVQLFHEDIVSIHRARAADTARMLENIGISVEVPA